MKHICQVGIKYKHIYTGMRYFLYTSHCFSKSASLELRIDTHLWHRNVGLLILKNKKTIIVCLTV